MRKQPTQKACFNSAAQANKRDDNKIDEGKEFCVYLNSISLAAIASNKRIQEMVIANKAKNDRVATLLANTGNE